MLSKFWKSMRIVLPPWWVLALYGFALVVFVGVELAMQVWVAWSLELSWQYTDALTFYSNLIPPGLLCYAIWRGWAYHPAWHGKYRQWLEKTPWQASRPLPFGPARLVWQDILIVGLATFAWSLPEDRLLVPLAFLVPYCLMLTLANFRTSIDWAGYSSLAVMASLLLVVDQSWEMLLLMLVVYVICHLGLRRSLKNFPWSDSPRWKALTLKMSGKQKHRAALWPFVHDTEHGEHQPWLAWKSVLGLSTLGGWIAFCLTSCYLRHVAPYEVRAFPHEFPAMMLGLSWFCCCGRIGAYCFKHWSPISLLGRLRTGRLIVRGYDRVLVAPLTILAVGYFLPRWLIAWSITMPAVAFLSLLALIATTLGAGPTLTDWHLTGQHRLYVHRPGPQWVQL